MLQVSVNVEVCFPFLFVGKNYRKEIFRFVKLACSSPVSAFPTNIRSLKEGPWDPPCLELN